ncbi:uncharacterized protein LOC134838025 isoform X3 [Culicoides brevitarsis]|uniref:uncharacterized protein LOC134838025 isoform X3 n=1 Tax=Culicoides brevitarsis TaxID=469753 RepID=UPI00307C6C71
MFLYKIFALALLFVNVNSMPQFITFDNGKIGVNFAGYHAEAGLGGLLTGNAAHGGLSASAGTPFGQKAGAGLGGTVAGNNGRTAGGLYAGATDGFGQGASAALGGKVDEFGPAGGSGAEAHAQGVSKKTVKLGQGNAVKEIHSVQYPSGGVSSGTVNAQADSVIDTRFADEVATPVVKKKVVHKEKTYVRPHKVKLHHRNNFAAGAVGAQAGPAAGGVTYTKTVNTGGSFFDDIFNIPISTLRAVNGFLNNNRAGVVTKTKTVAYEA